MMTSSQIFLFYTNFLNNCCNFDYLAWQSLYLFMIHHEIVYIPLNTRTSLALVLSAKHYAAESPIK